MPTSSDTLQRPRRFAACTCEDGWIQVGSRWPSASPQALHSAAAAPPTRPLHDLMPARHDWAQGHDSTSFISILRPAFPCAAIGAHAHINMRGCWQREVNLRLVHCHFPIFPSHLPASGEISSAAPFPATATAERCMDSQLSARDGRVSPKAIGG
jgi:hypothetical protein